MPQVKLNPSIADAWLCLGGCIWKKGDLPAAKNCFNLALSKVIYVPDCKCVLYVSNYCCIHSTCFCSLVSVILNFFFCLIRVQIRRYCVSYQCLKEGWLMVRYFFFLLSIQIVFLHFLGAKGYNFQTLFFGYLGTLSYSPIDNRRA